MTRLPVWPTGARASPWVSVSVLWPFLSFSARKSVRRGRTALVVRQTLVPPVVNGQVASVGRAMRQIAVAAV